MSPTFAQAVDEHGQPLIRNFNAKRVRERGVDELLGLCKGLVVDNQVCQAEAEYLLRWLEANRDVTYCWPGDVIAARIGNFMADGRLAPQEQAELFDLLAKVTGETKLKGLAANKSTSLPFTDPAPSVDGRANGARGGHP